MKVENIVTGKRLTDEQFYRKGRRWANKIYRKAKANAQKFKKGKGSGYSSTYIKVYQTGIYAGRTEYPLYSTVHYGSKRGEDGILQSVWVQFPIHGIMREYGVGEGRPRKPGKKISSIYKPQNMESPWVSKPIDKNIKELADLAQEFYADKATTSIFLGKKNNKTNQNYNI